MLPTANHVAWAIVAACRETGDDPIAIATGAAKGRNPRVGLRARHYALHALIFKYPDLLKAKAAEFVGAPGKPAAFYNNSMNQVARVVNHTTGRRMANWWDEEGFERVIQAIEAVGPGIESTHPIENDEPELPPAPRPVKVADVAPPPHRPFMSERQGKAYRMLQEAMANTAKLPTEK